MFVSVFSMAVATWQRAASDVERWWDAVGDGICLLLFAPFFWLPAVFHRRYEVTIIASCHCKLARAGV